MATRAAARKSSPRKAAPRKAAPRRAAARTGGSTVEEAPVNGVVLSPSEDPNAEQIAKATPNGAVDFVALQGIDDPYPEGIPRFTYLPEDGSPAIVFPAFTTLRPNRKFIWSIYKKNALVQGFEWMNLAEVPDRIQERVIDLPDIEYGRFWEQWFQQILPTATANPDGTGTPGES